MGIALTLERGTYVFLETSVKCQVDYNISIDTFKCESLMTLVRLFDHLLYWIQSAATPVSKDRPNLLDQQVALL